MIQSYAIYEIHLTFKGKQGWKFRDMKKYSMQTLNQNTGGLSILISKTK